MTLDGKLGKLTAEDASTDLTALDVRRIVETKESMDLDANFEVVDKLLPSLQNVAPPHASERFSAAIGEICLEHVDELVLMITNLHNELVAARAGDNVQVEYAKQVLEVDWAPDGCQHDDRSHAHAIPSQTGSDRIDN